jgi:hypothetical protein
MAQTGEKTSDLIHRATQYRWANPGSTWEQVATHIGKSTRQLDRYRETEAWEIAFREAGNEYVEKLAPAAVHALVKAWAKGNPAGAIDVLRSFGFLTGEKLTVRFEVEGERETLTKLLELRQA